MASPPKQRMLYIRHCSDVTLSARDDEDGFSDGVDYDQLEATPVCESPAATSPLINSTNDSEAQALSKIENTHQPSEASFADFFFRLPREIRDQIYEYHLDHALKGRTKLDFQRPCFTKTNPASGSKRKRNEQMKLNEADMAEPCPDRVPMAGLNRQFRDEVTDRLCARVTYEAHADFSCKRPEDLNLAKALRSAGESMAQSLRSIRITVSRVKDATPYSTALWVSLFCNSLRRGPSLKTNKVVVEHQLLRDMRHGFGGGSTHSELDWRTVLGKTSLQIEYDIDLGVTARFHTRQCKNFVLGTQYLGERLASLGTTSENEILKEVCNWVTTGTRSSVIFGESPVILRHLKDFEHVEG